MAPKKESAIAYPLPPNAGCKTCVAARLVFRGHHNAAGQNPAKLQTAAFRRDLWLVAYRLLPVAVHHANTRCPCHHWSRGVGAHFKVHDLSRLRSHQTQSGGELLNALRIA